MVPLAEFTWKVATDRYAVAVANSDSCLRSEAEEEETQVEQVIVRRTRDWKRTNWARTSNSDEELVRVLIPSSGQPLREYEPLVEQPALFQRFASLDLSEDALVSFANLFGLPRPDVQVVPPWHADDRYHSFGDDSDPTFVSGMDLSGFEVAIRSLRRAVNLSDAVMSADSEKIGELISFVSEDDYADVEIDSDDDDLQAAQMALDHVISSGIRSRLHFKMSGGRLQGVPTHLLGAMWLQATEAVQEGKRFRKCPARSCPVVWFEVSKGPLGVRTDAEFCSAGCRHTAYRDRKKSAQEMHQAGMAATQIAERLNTDVERIRRWTKPRGN